MEEKELLWEFLPEGLEEYFNIDGYEKNENRFRITLIEKNIIPSELEEEYQGKKVINTVLDNIIIDDFPIRGRKGELLLKRRSWKFEGVKKMLKRKINICAEGTKLEKEFADFLKEMDRE